MKKVSKLKMIPLESEILNGFSEVGYLDIYEIQKKTQKTAEEITKEIMKFPRWVEFLLKVRNTLVHPFGLKTEKPKDEQESFFMLLKKTENEIIMGENDKHLNFRASIFIDKSKETIAFITLVHYHNIWGKIYFLPVKPFHKIIIKSLLKRFLKQEES